MGKAATRTAQRYTDILNAAAALLKEGGMYAVTTDRIRQRINASPTTIYCHFENRDQILEEVFKDTHAKFYATAEYKLQFAHNSEEQLATIIEGAFAEELFTATHMHSWIASINYYLYHQGQFSYAPEAHSRAIERTKRLFLELGDKDPDASPQFWAFVDGLWLHAALSKGSLSRDKCIDRTFTFVEKRLGKRLPRKADALLD